MEPIILLIIGGFLFSIGIKLHKDNYGTIEMVGAGMAGAGIYLIALGVQL